MLRRIYNKLINSSLFCPVCSEKAYQFLPLSNIYKDNLEKNGFRYAFDDFETLNYKAYSCLHCDASDRDRLYALYISKYFKDNKVSNISMLEIAPSRPLSEYLKRSGKISLRTADLMMDGVDDRIDITNMSCYADEKFDTFICSHVLEHVHDDIDAVRELYRILKPGGWGILMVPIVLAINKIDEDPLVQDEGERWRRFGQDDHVRMYSKNGFIERVQSAGFIVSQYGQSYFGLDVFKKHGISKDSVLYVVEK